MSGEEISQWDHGHNRKDLEPIRAWIWPLSALPRARRRAQALERALALARAHPERVSEPPLGRARPRL
jgi:plasmid stabilization system protein ParE